MSAQKVVQYVLIGVGTLVVVVGLAVGLIPMHEGATACGSLFRPENGIAVAMSGGDWQACDAAASTRKGIVWVLVGLGALLALGGLLLALKDHELQQAEQATVEG